MENIDAIQDIETSNIQRIAIKNLVKSPLNVCKKEGSGIAELAALISSQGLIQNRVEDVEPELGAFGLLDPQS